MPKPIDDQQEQDTIEGAEAEPTLTDVADDETIKGGEGEDTAAGGDDTTEGAAASGDEAANEETLITIGDEPLPTAPEAAAPQWVRDLRKSHREQQRRIRELEDQVRGKAPGDPAAPVQLGKKPTLEEFDYDADKFETALAGWFDRKRQADDQAAAASRAEAEAKAEWDSQVDRYGKMRDSLRMSDYDEVEAAVGEKLTAVQMGLLIDVCENPALTLYAAGKSPAKLAELAAITKPARFIAALVRFEATVKTNRRTSTVPAPERTVSGTAPKSGSVDSTLERLRAEADRTGDMTKVIAYKRQLRERKAG